MKDFIVYAHRGASEYCPENTLLSFYTGVYMRANGIETDVQRTKDGVLVLFHDDTIERMMKKPGSIKDYTLAELSEIPMTTAGRTDYIVTVEDFLSHFSKFDLTFAIELKVRGVAQDTADLIDKYGCADKVVITSFDYECLLEMKACAPHLKLGYLVSTGKFDEAVIEKLVADDICEVCPRASNATEELVDKAHALGLNVRAWGAFNEELMRHVYEIGCNGTTINFPDKLVQYISEKEA